MVCTGWCRAPRPPRMRGRRPRATPRSWVGLRAGRALPHLDARPRDGRHPTVELEAIFVATGGDRIASSLLLAPQGWAYYEQGGAAWSCWPLPTTRQSRWTSRSASVPPASAERIRSTRLPHLLATVHVTSASATSPTTAGSRTSARERCSVPASRDSRGVEARLLSGMMFPCHRPRSPRRF